MSEWLMQRRLFYRVRNGSIAIAHNCYALGWECDLLRVTKNRYVHGYEMKMSVADYRMEFKKTGRDNRRRPNYFWFVVPENLIAVTEVPDDAGLLYFHRMYFKVAKPAPRLHREKATDADVIRVLTSVHWRHWDIEMAKLRDWERQYNGNF